MDFAVVGGWVHTCAVIHPVSLVGQCLPLPGMVLVLTDQRAGTLRGGGLSSASLCRVPSVGLPAMFRAQV